MSITEARSSALLAPSRKKENNSRPVPDAVARPLRAKPDPVSISEFGKRTAARHLCGCTSFACEQHRLFGIAPIVYPSFPELPRHLN